MLASVMLSACGAFQSQPSSTEGPVDQAEIIWVVDGDTVDLEIDGQKQRVRLIGIDTPESVSRSTPDQCYGAEASLALTGLIPPGTMVRVARDTEPRDRYGRLLLYLYRLPDDLFINEWMVHEGFAEAVSYRPNTTFEQHFDQTRDRSRERGAGLWGHCDGPDQPLE
jgi:micrococcal nuclease